MKKSKRPNGRTGTLLWWPIFFLPVLIISGALICFVPEYTYYVLLGVAVIVAIYLVIWFAYWKKHFREELLYFAQSFNEIQSDELENLDIAAVLINEELEINWCNKKFKKIFKEDVGSTLENFNEDLVYAIKDAFMGEGESPETITFVEKNFTFKAKVEKSKELVTVWFFDESELHEKIQIIEDMNPAVITLCFDNYEEVSARLDDMQKSILVAHVQQVVSEYFSLYGAIVTSVDKDKYIINLDNKALAEIRKDKFSILEKIRGTNASFKAKPTLSIGVGSLGENIAENSKYAKEALDLCLGRGGDQAILKSPKGFVFYGGKTESQEKITRIKTRSFSRDLKELILEKDTVLIMSHKLPDSDAFGSSVALLGIAKKLGKKAYIVLDKVPGGIKAICDYVMSSKSQDEKFIITKKEALDFNIDRTLLIITDVNRPSIVESKEILDRFKTRVVIDHHRLAEEQIENRTLSYIEPAASSVSEILCEVLQYISEDVIINEAEAEALYAGIIIDSDNFLTKTGYRTFEAAAYLKKMGADMANVRKLLRETKEEVLAKTAAVSSAKIYKEHFIFGKCEAEGLENPTVIGAKAANELLEIKAIKASFVFTPFEKKIFISARSIDEVNVQLVMEALGGGGHLSVAGAQLEEVSLEQAVAKVKEVIDNMLKEGEI